MDRAPLSGSEGGEIAHFDDERTLDIRLTKGAIRARRRGLSADIRMHLRPGNSDWLQIHVEIQSDCDYALTLVQKPSVPTFQPPLRVLR